MNNKKVSIVVPLFNAEKYLCECLDSLVNQTYDNIEIILINDGSKDRTGDICEKYAKKDSRIKYISKENKGVSHSRNIGLEVASGEYITFVDGDDWIELDCIESALKHIENNDVLQFNIIREKNGEHVYKKFSKRTDTSLIDKDLLILNTVAPELIEKKQGFIGESRAACGKLYNKKVLLNIKFNEKLKFYEDGEFFLKVIKNSKKYCSLDRGLYHYRINCESCTNSYRKNFENEAKNVVLEIEKVIEKRELLDYVKLDMLYSCINNVTRKKDFNFYDIKRICNDSFWKIKKTKKIKTYGIKRKIVCFCAQNKLSFVVWALCKIKSISRRGVKK